MKVTIDIPEHYARVLSKWASVSRTLNEAKDLVLSVEQDDVMIKDRVQACYEELNDVEPALNCLHQLARSQIWKLEPDDEVRQGLNLDEKYGMELLRTDKHVLRAKREGDDDITVYIHDIADGNEMRPNGYLIGSNYLSTIK